MLHLFIRLIAHAIKRCVQETHMQDTIFVHLTVMTVPLMKTSQNAKKLQ